MKQSALRRRIGDLAPSPFDTAAAGMAARWSGVLERGVGFTLWNTRVREKL